MITTAQIDGAIQCLEYHHFRNTTQMVCCATLQNGYTVIGQSSCADPAEFDLALGQQYALQDAKGNIASLLAFVQRELQSQPQGENYAM